MAPDKNITVAQKVVSQLDTNLYVSSQKMLIEFYKEFPVLGHNILGVTYAQLLVAFLLSLFIFILRPLFVSWLIKLLIKFTQKTKSHFDDHIASGLYGPLKFAFLILALYIFVSILYIKTPLVNSVLQSLTLFNFFWILWAIADGVQNALGETTLQLNHKLSKELFYFVLKIIKVVIWAVGASALLSLWGVNITAFVASLGLGGLAFALAAKDTAANLFGSMAILMDNSIKIGNWIKVDGVEGIVEDVGMRTTKIRTFEKSIVAVPNQIVANSPIENFSRRSVRRVVMRIGLTYETTNAQIEAIISDITKMLKSHKGIAQSETMLVNFDNFGNSAQEIFIYTFTNTANWQEYLNIKEDIQYKISDIVAKNGSSFAFPSQSIYIESIQNAPTEAAKRVQS